MDHPQNKPPVQWRLRQPVSKADMDAIREFKRHEARRKHLVEELMQVDSKLLEAFETLRRRGQVEEVGHRSPSTETTPPEEQGQ